MTIDKVSAFATFTTIVTIAAALLTATGISLHIGFILFTLASALWAYYAMETNQTQLFYTNLVLLIINIAGIIIHK